MRRRALGANARGRICLGCSARPIALHRAHGSNQCLRAFRFNAVRHPLAPRRLGSIVDRLYSIVEPIDHCGIASHAVTEWRERRGDFGGTKPTEENAVISARTLQ
jgi:hypothetical protein